MEERTFNEQEWVEPQEMKVYWSLMRWGLSKKVANTLVLILKVTEKRVKLVRLNAYLDLGNHRPVEYVKKENFKISGIPSEIADLTMEDYLTCDSEVIRKAALDYRKRNDGQD